jgi:hypothetical protein
MISPLLYPWCQKFGLFLEEDAFREGTIGKIDIVVKSNSSCVILSRQTKTYIFLLIEKMELLTSFHMKTNFALDPLPKDGVYG